MNNLLFNPDIETIKFEYPDYIPERFYNIDMCVDLTDYNKFKSKIINMNISDDEKRILLLAATRHIKFNYKALADYYNSASSAMKDIMEKLGLIILDIDGAIKNNYIALNKSTYKLLFNDPNIREGGE